MVPLSGVPDPATPGVVTAAPPRAAAISVRGVVQGVGLRPWIYNMARRHQLGGWVRNDSGDVEIQIEGAASGVECFIDDLHTGAPPLARLTTIAVRRSAPAGYRSFSVTASTVTPGRRLPVAPDASICAKCRSELRDPLDRRYRFPFITCTACGPRYTLIESLPWDRERTTMRTFVQCPACEAEYEDPSNRRFRSETNCCPDCGPRLWLESAAGAAVPGDPIDQAATLLRNGGILALRGLGGFHLAVDARNQAAVERLRRRKQRDAKPLAVMVTDIAAAATIGRIGPVELDLLESAARPIVLLERSPAARLAPAVAPGLSSVGVMLAYTPLHLLLLEAVGRPLVMTSGNLTDEPIALSNEEARERLGGIADAFLLHDREIVSRYDDSVVRVAGRRSVMIRRSRGYAPLPLELPVPAPRPLVATGSHLKNTFTLADGATAWVSQHIGDLDNAETLAHFRDSLERFSWLFQITPTMVACDLHPAYLSTRLARELGLGEPVAVQHHHAHVAAVLGEHAHAGPVIGVAFDGTGWGSDDTIWGGEFLIADLAGMQRAAHLRAAPLPGGDLAARSPWRAALGYLSLEPAASSEFQLARLSTGTEELAMVERMLARRVNSPMASSMGRLFDAAAAVIGLRHRTAYEGQAAMELESLAGDAYGMPLPFPLVNAGDDLVLDPLPLLAALGELACRGHDTATLAARFHESVIRATCHTVETIAGRTGLDTVVLSGGTFQNARLHAGISSRLEAAGFTVLVPRQLSPNDGAISYGQAVVAAAVTGR